MKSKTKSQSTNTYGYQTPPHWAGAEEFHNQIGQLDKGDPSIPFAFAHQREELKNRFDNPFGFNYSPEVQDAIKYSQGQNIDQAEGQAHREDYYNRQQAKLGALGAYAGMTAPTLVQTGGTFQGTQTQPIGPALIGAAGQIGGAALG